MMSDHRFAAYPLALRGKKGKIFRWSKRRTGRSDERQVIGSLGLQALEALGDVVFGGPFEIEIADRSGQPQLA
jgi:hypothetical protein